MKTKRYSTEQIIGILNEAKDVCRSVSESIEKIVRRRGESDKNELIFTRN
ncbi:hypothetical protein [Prosthecochloris sp. ZM_2]|nr:hypothetical protein [Prosthecochloris sp. ZM_2]